MVADDDDDTLHSIKDFFEHRGYEVSTVKDGFACIEMLENGFEGILLVDIMMPKMDGWDTIREIVNRGLEKNVEILVITAIGTPRHEKMKGLETYIHDYIAKPFDVNELAENIKQWI
ncbi:MAG: response regulator transcription factor [Petrotogales bacterium]